MEVKGVSERVQRVHKEAIIVDMLESFPRITERNLGYFETLVDAGVTVVHATVPNVLDDLSAAIEKVANFYKLVERTENAKIARTVADIESMKREGKVALIMGMQNSVPFERNLDLIRVFDMLGIKVVQVAYSEQNYLGAGCGEQVDHGLTDFGREAVMELNRLGILIDVSHCGNKTAIDTAEASKDPIALTHTTPRALVDIPRARTDETIKAIAERGGVIGQTIYTSFCEKISKPGVRPTISDFVDIIDYLVDLVGIDHVGLGLDLSLFGTKETHEAFWARFRNALIYPHKPPSFEEIYVQGFNDIRDIIKIIEELLTHGYSDEKANKILGGNWLRLLKEVWK